MKVFIALFVYALAPTTLAALDQERLKQRVHATEVAGETCNADPATRISKEEIEKWQKGGEEPANAVAHALCVSKAVGWQNADGSLNVETLRSRISENYDDHAKVEEITKNCVQAQATPEATITFVAKCIFKYNQEVQNIHHH